MKKNKPGRPQKSAEEKRVKTSISLPPAVLASIKNQAANAGVPVSAIIEAAVMAVCNPVQKNERLQALAETIQSAAGEIAATLRATS